MNKFVSDNIAVFVVVTGMVAAAALVLAMRAGRCASSAPAERKETAAQGTEGAGE